MRRRIGLELGAVVLIVLATGGCIKKARLYNLSTGEVIPAEFTYSGSGKGKITAVSSTGEQMTGEYVTIPGGIVNWGSIYASVYGPGGAASGSGVNYSSSMESKQRGTAIVTGDRGTIVQCEYVTSALNGAGTGACKDNRGVFYRLMF
jgi:hypothetical protein